MGKGNKRHAPKLMVLDPDNYYHLTMGTCGMLTDQQLAALVKVCAREKAELGRSPAAYFLHLLLTGHMAAQWYMLAYQLWPFFVQNGTRPMVDVGTGTAHLMWELLYSHLVRGQTVCIEEDKLMARYARQALGLWLRGDHGHGSRAMIRPWSLDLAAASPLTRGRFGIVLASYLLHWHGHHLKEVCEQLIALAASDGAVVILGEEPLLSSDSPFAKFTYLHGHVPENVPAKRIAETMRELDWDLAAASHVMIDRRHYLFGLVFTSVHEPNGSLFMHPVTRNHGMRYMLDLANVQVGPRIFLLDSKHARSMAKRTSRRINEFEL